jgi:formylglycine-generating enzyme required for sulfatase activity
MRTIVSGLAISVIFLSQHPLFSSISDANQSTSSQSTPRASKKGKTFRDCQDCPEMVKIPAGSFMMGAPASEPGRDAIEGPQRPVSIRSFAAGKFDVTRGQWAAFVSATRRPTVEGCDYSGFEKKKEQATASWSHLGFEQDDTHPVVCVTFVDAQDYVQWLSAKTGKKYRLMSEAEWEYAARAGTSTTYPWGSSASHKNANYGKDACCSGLASGRDSWEYTSPVGSFPPNAFGLYDMHGNVLQAVQDCLATSYPDLPADGSAYESDVALKMTGRFADMTGQPSCSFKMLCGGDWGDPPAMIRSAFRNFTPPSGSTLEQYRSAGVGFRIARNLD